MPGTLSSDTSPFAIRLGTGFCEIKSTMNPDAADSRRVHDFLTDSAKRWPDKVALVCGSHRLTYGEIERRARQVAEALRSRGIQRGDRVVLCLGNGVEVVVGIFAVLMAGGTFVVVNPNTKERKLAYIANDCGAAALFIEGRMASLGLGVALLKEAPSLRVLVSCGEPAGSIDGDSRSVSFQTLMDGAHRPPSGASDVPEMAGLIYTSGTTGAPKGVICDHRNIVFAAASICQYLESSETDVVLSVLPLSFTYGLYQLFTTFRAGATLVLETSFAYPVSVVRRMEHERVTAFPGVPTMFRMLLRMDLTKFDLSRMRYLTNAAGPLSRVQVEEIHRRFPHAKFYSMYGQTETARSLYLPPRLLEEKPESVGIAIPGTHAWVETESGERAAPGIVGELVVSGRHVMRGYWGDTAATVARFRAGPSPGERTFRTGDLFRADEDGCLWFVSRTDDIIKTRGEKVAPREVESALCRLEGIVAAAVVGVPDAFLGQAIKAVVTSDAPLTVAQVLAHCRSQLEEFMVPRYVEFRDAMPMTESGKIKKRELV
jgi:amino acid adenylation domain-containing protein